VAQDVEGIGEGGGVRHGGPRGDEVEGVADDVREDHRRHLGRGGHPGQAPPLDLLDVLADGVDLVDCRPRAEQGLGQALVIGQADLGLGEHHQGRSPAGDEADHQVLLPRALEQLDDLAGAGEGALVWEGVAGLAQPDPFGLVGVAVLDVDQAPVDAVAQHRLDRSGHRRARLACPDDEYAPVAPEVVAPPADRQGVALEPEGVPHRLGGVDRPQGGADDPPGQVPSRRRGRRHLAHRVVLPPIAHYVSIASSLKEGQHDGSTRHALHGAVG
jgi:hypothetical protein